MSKPCLITQKYYINFFYIYTHTYVYVFTHTLSERHKIIATYCLSDLLTSFSISLIPTRSELMFLTLKMLQNSLMSNHAGEEVFIPFISLKYSTLPRQAEG